MIRKPTSVRRTTELKALTRSEIMRRIKSKGNKSTELRMKQLLRDNGITGWRRGSKLFGRPDFVFAKKHVAIFIDGCFWHGHPTLCRLPKTNLSYWLQKIARNKERDKAVVSHLKKAGWRVLRIWECALQKRPQACVSRILRVLKIQG